jgi:enoyl-CoA hydratase
VAEPRDVDVVTWTELDRIFRVQLNAPPANALGSTLVTGLAAAIDAFTRSHARVLMLSSGVPDYFATGAPEELPAGQTTTNSVNQTLELGITLGRLANGDRPSIAVIDGLALGTGLGLAMACTLRVGSRTARMGLPEHQLGPISGEQAREIGLLDQLVGAGQARDAAVELAAELTTRSGPALTQIWRDVGESIETSPPLDRSTAGTLSTEHGTRARLLALLQHGRTASR